MAHYVSSSHRPLFWDANGSVWLELLFFNVLKVPLSGCFSCDEVLGGSLNFEHI